MLKPKVYLHLESLVQLNDLILHSVLIILALIDIFLSKPDFNCDNKFALSWFDKVTTGTWRFVSVIVNLEFWVLIITQFSDYVKISSNS